MAGRSGARGHDRQSPGTRASAAVWEGYAIRIVDVDSGANDASDLPFLIPEPPAVEIDPNASEAG
jgi:hypothetical protein